MNSDLSDLQKRNSIHVKTLQENYENKINLLLEEKDMQINQLANRIEELDSLNKDLAMRLENNFKDIDEIRDSTNDSLKELQMNLINKEGEFKLKADNYESRINSIIKNSEEEKNKIVYDYESRIEQMIDQFEEARNRLTKMLQDREIDIKNLIQRQREEVTILEKENLELRSEIDCHKQNILASKYL